jgi:predicted permease
MTALLEVILPVFLVVGFGYAAVWRGLFSDAGVDGLMKFTQGFAIPCLLFNAISQLDVGDNFQPALLFSYYGPALICFAAGIAVSRFVLGRNLEDAIVIGFACMFANSVLLGLPITERAYGHGALAGNYALVALNAPFCYGVGITTMEIARNRGASARQLLPKVLRAMFGNNLIIGICLGFAVNLSGVPVPVVLSDAIDMMIRAALPASLFGLGGVLYRYRPEGDIRAILMICAITLLLRPLLSFGMGTAFALDTDAMRSLTITAAMAPGVNAYVFSDMYDRARRVAAASVLVATALCILTVWGWLAILP